MHPHEHACLHAFARARAQVIHYDIKSSNVLLDTLSKYVVRAHCQALAWHRSRVQQASALLMNPWWHGRPCGTRAL